MRSDRNVCATYAAEAAARAGLSTDIVLRVMKAESGGRRAIVSPKGAMGCMQIMPATWRYLSKRYRTGSDAFEPRQNMIAGAAYLAELIVRFGLPGAFAAYNAGPARYESYQAGRAVLPPETIAYVARIGSRINPPHVAAMARWQAATLFIAVEAPQGSVLAASRVQSVASSDSRKMLFPLIANNPDRDVEPATP